MLNSIFTKIYMVSYKNFIYEKPNKKKQQNYNKYLDFKTQKEMVSFFKTYEKNILLNTEFPTSYKNIISFDFNHEQVLNYFINKFNKQIYNLKKKNKKKW